MENVLVLKLFGTVSVCASGAGVMPAAWPGRGGRRLDAPRPRLA